MLAMGKVIYTNNLDTVANIPPETITTAAGVTEFAAGGAVVVVVLFFLKFLGRERDLAREDRKILVDSLNANTDILYKINLKEEERYKFYQNLNGKLEKAIRDRVVK